MLRHSPGGPASAPGNTMKNSVKSALESALVAILLSGACLWLLIDWAQKSEIEPGHPGMAVLYSLGLLCGLVAHWTYMGRALRRAGRSVLLWMPALVMLVPVTSVVLAVILSSHEEESAGDAEPRTPG